MNNVFEYEIVKSIKVLCEKNGYTKEINLIKYAENEPMIDIRKWNRNNDRMQKGISLTKEEAELLKNALNDFDWGEGEK